MGLNETSTRMVSTISGTVSLLFLYFFLKEFVKNKKLRWFVFVILAFEPWRMHFARVALEANLSACFFIVGSWFLYKNKKLKKQKKPILKMILISLFFALAAYSYHGARLAAPAFIILFIFDPIKLFFVKKFKFYKKWFFKFKLNYLNFIVCIIYHHCFFS
jgi:dolichyl-phosphate-mannose--protein O-mannosyl transferase